MLLALDVGNTETTLGLHDGREWRHRWRVSTRRAGTEDEWALTLDGLLRLAGLGLDDIDGLALASGVPVVTAALTSFGRRFSQETVVVNARTAGIEIGYRTPQTLGADRIANAVAAWEKYRRPVIVVDFGTATNFDFVSEGGRFEGGPIAPGLMITVEALIGRTAQLPQVDVLKGATEALGRDTHSALTAGLFLGYLSMVEGLLARLRLEVGPGVEAVATGGLSTVMAQWLKFADVDPNLTLDGVRLVRKRCLKATR